MKKKTTQFILFHINHGRMIVFADLFISNFKFVQSSMRKAVDKSVVNGIQQLICEIVSINLIVHLAIFLRRNSHGKRYIPQISEKVFQINSIVETIYPVNKIHSIPFRFI